MFPPLPHVMNFTKWQRLSEALSVHLFRDFSERLHSLYPSGCGGLVPQTGCISGIPHSSSFCVPNLRGALPPQSAFVLPLRSIQAKSALLLLVTRILADDHNATLALNDLALLAHRFY